MRKFALIAALALVGATGALAAKPAHPTTPASTHANSHATASASTAAVAAVTTAPTTTMSSKPPKVLFVLRGTLSKYMAANGATNGAISITVKSLNHDSSPTLKNTTLTFPVSSSTKVVLHDGKPIADNDKGIVKVRAQKNSSAATLMTLTAFQVIDQGAST